MGTLTSQFLLFADLYYLLSFGLATTPLNALESLTCTSSVYCGLSTARAASSLEVSNSSPDLAHLSSHPGANKPICAIFQELWFNA
jgi:hypothetical protein